MRTQSYALLSLLSLGLLGLGACANMPEREVASQCVAGQDSERCRGEAVAQDGVTPAGQWHERVDSYLNQPLFMKRN